MDIVLQEKIQFAQSLGNKLDALINPGKTKLNIHTFGYRRFLPNGKSFGFCDNDRWNKTFRDQFCGLSLPEYEQDVRQYMQLGTPFLLRAGFPDQNSHFLKALYEKDVWNTLIFFQKNLKAGCLEAFFLSTHRENTGIIGDYMNSLSFIYQWITQIRTKLQIYFDCSTDKYFSTTLTSNDCLESLALFLQPSTVPLVAGLDPFFKHKLSVREYEILSLLELNYKRSKIAMALRLSPKTIDSYVARIKEKTQTLSKAGLLRMLQNNTCPKNVIIP